MAKVVDMSAKHVNTIEIMSAAGTKTCASLRLFFVFIPPIECPV